MVDFDSTLFSEENRDKWRNERWEKHGILKLLRKDGFTFKSDGRSGYIYYIEQGTLVEIYVEMSGVKRYDMLVYFDEKLKRFPSESILNNDEKEILKEKLLSWFEKKGIKSDL
ncbi:hypothetical protein [Pedobacter sp.]|uniref:hypothetical protein n=1 Tax=Pedobacter sp. TaxID=1411316 RepID=UPI0031DB3476